MNTRKRLYIMAFAAYTSALLVATVFAWLALQYSTAAGVVQLAVVLSGNGIGGFALLFGILRDDRAQKADERTAKAEESAKQSEQKAAKARQDSEQFKQQAEQFKQQAEQFKQQAESERLRAERAEAELGRVRDERDREIAARFSRIEAALGLPSLPDASTDATEN